MEVNESEAPNLSFAFWLTNSTGMPARVLALSSDHSGVIEVELKLDATSISGQVRIFGIAVKYVQGHKW